MATAERTIELGTPVAIEQTTPRAEVEQEASRMPAAVLLVAILAAFTIVVAYAPAVVGFGTAVGGAVAWCRWLDRRPTHDPTENPHELVRSSQSCDSYRAS